MTVKYFIIASLIAVAGGLSYWEYLQKKSIAPNLENSSPEQSGSVSPTPPRYPLPDSATWPDSKSPNKSARLAENTESSIEGVLADLLGKEVFETFFKVPGTVGRFTSRPG